MTDPTTITHKELQRLGRLFLTADVANLGIWEDQHIHEWLNAQLTAAYTAEAASERFDIAAPSDFDTWPSLELAAQCRMQARDTAQWGTEDSKKYEAFMLVVAKRLTSEMNI